MFELFINPLLDPVVHLSIRIGLALLFFTAVLHKIRDLQKFCADIRAYKLLPEAFVPMAAMVLISLECLLVFSLPLLSLSFPLVLAATLLMAYALAISVNLLRGRRHIDCGCYGPAKSQQNIQPNTITTYLVIRNILLASIAMLCLLPVITEKGIAGEFSWLDLSLFPLYFLAFVFLYQSIELLFSQREFVRQFNEISNRNMA